MVHMKAGKLTLKYVPVDSLKENPENARIHGSEIEELINSVDRFGFADVIKVDKNMTIIAGHGRLQAAKANGMKEVPIIVLPFTKEEAKAFALVDNKTSDDSTWDVEKHDTQIEELKALGWDMGAFGFELPDFGDFAPAPVTDEPVVDDPTPAPKPKARESMNVIAYCNDEEQRDKVLAFLIENDIPGQLLGN